MGMQTRKWDEHTVDSPQGPAAVKTPSFPLTSSYRLFPDSSLAFSFSMIAHHLKEGGGKSKKPMTHFTPSMHVHPCRSGASPHGSVSTCPGVRALRPVLLSPLGPSRPGRWGLTVCVPRGEGRSPRLLLLRFLPQPPQRTGHSHMSLCRQRAQQPSWERACLPPPPPTSRGRRLQEGAGPLSPSSGSQSRPPLPAPIRNGNRFCGIFLQLVSFSLLWNVPPACLA